MAMSTSGADEEMPGAEINVTPLADVMLVLLIIFMITAPLMSHKIKVSLPNANPDTKAVPTDVQPIDLAVLADGSTYWDGSEVDHAILSARLRAEASNSPQPELQIRADKDTPYSTIWKVLETAKDAGMVHVGFITQGNARKGAGGAP